jgi:polyphenol oxidase
MQEDVLPQPNESFRWTQTAGLTALVCEALDPVAPHLFTTRAWMLAASKADPAGWDQVAGAVGVHTSHLVLVRQVHGASVSVVRRGALSSAARTGQDNADIMITDDRDVALAIRTADCVPVLIADRRTGVVAAAHAGWRGLAAAAPQATVVALAREFGSRPGDLVAAIGPSISAARYEVGQDVRDRFEAARFERPHLDRWFAEGTRAGHWQFDGWQSARDQLEMAGVPAEQVHVAGLCTSAHEGLFCSYRRDGAGAGRLAAVIRLRNG